MYGCPCGDGPCDGTARKRNCAHVGGGAARTEKPLEFPQRFGRTIHVSAMVRLLAGQNCRRHQFCARENAGCLHGLARAACSLMASTLVSSATMWRFVGKYQLVTTGPKNRA